MSGVGRKHRSDLRVLSQSASVFGYFAQDECRPVAKAILEELAVWHPTGRDTEELIASIEAKERQDEST
jgi:hypothetical protein